MKNYFKFFVVVFGVTIATFGTMPTKAAAPITGDSGNIQCLDGSTKGCAKTTKGWITGIRQESLQ